jgi:hypothetical protein
VQEAVAGRASPVLLADLFISRSPDRLAVASASRNQPRCLPYRVSYTILAR